MELIAVLCLIATLLIRWVYLKQRLDEIEERIAGLARQVSLSVPRPVSAPQPERRPMPAPPAQPAPGPATPPAIPAPVHPAAPRSTWEEQLGGNWLNKAGVLVLVVGLALALGYSFAHMGAWGRVITSLAVSGAMLVAGAALEGRERYRVFARGLLGGGWAALYVTVFAMHWLEAARVVTSPVAGFLLLLAVAAGMILHSLRYRSQTVTGVAWFVAFGTLAITDLSALPLMVLIPLAGSLLYACHRFAWPRMAMAGLAATYFLCVLHGDTGAPLAETQAIFAACALLFEVFDVLHPEAWLLPLNAAGFLGLSLLKWQAAAPDRVWMLLAASSAAWLASALARARRGHWHGAALLSAGLAAAAVFQKLTGPWVAPALAVEAEIVYLTGVRLRNRYLRLLGGALFAVEAGRLLASDAWTLPAGQWVPVAATNAVVFYANRFLCAADVVYGFAGALMLAIVTGQQAPETWCPVAWLLLAALPFLVGWWRRHFDFRLQAYLLLIWGLTAAAEQPRAISFAVAAALCYAASLCTMRSGDRMPAEEREAVTLAASMAAIASAAAWVWQAAPARYLGIAWFALALPVFELGMRGWPARFRRLSYAMALCGLLRLAACNLDSLFHRGPWPPRLIPTGAALVAYGFALRGRGEERGKLFAVASGLGALCAMGALAALLPVRLVAVAWAGEALALLAAGVGWKVRLLRVQSFAVAVPAFLCCWAVHFAARMEWPWSLAVIACFCASLLLAPSRGRARLCYSILASALATLLLYYKVSGSMFTVACGIEGAVWLASGFALRERVLRLLGLSLLLFCVLKLFLWDLRHLETVARIVSFLALGVILVTVSWVYTRFREMLAKYL